MTDVRRIGDSGIHTVEGNIAGARAARLTKQRDAQQAEYEAVKNKIKQQNSAQIGRIDDKFSSATDAAEQEFRRRTVGLVSAEDFRKARTSVDEDVKCEKERQLKLESDKSLELKKKERAEKRKKMAAALSFEVDDGNDNNDDTSKPALKKVTKNPTIDTSYLPDREREQALEAEKQRLREEWLQQQEIVKQEILEVVYSYWDGSGHRRSIQVKKGATIGRFLELVKQHLSSEFSDLRHTSTDNLIYVKEDLIIPHNFSFYDLIVTKARGKSGPLFHFDVHDDVRLTSDARVEKDESHPGKIVLRSWYERNKHIFPASRWEVFDPGVQREKYTIHGGEVANR